MSFVRDYSSPAGQPAIPARDHKIIKAGDGLLLLFCDSGAIRTRDPQLRRLLLYPTELRNHWAAKIIKINFNKCN